MSIFCGLIREECNIFHSQSTVKTLESASQLPYRHMLRRLSYFPRALKVRWTFAQRGPKWNGADQGYDRYPPLRKVGHAGADSSAGITG